MKLEVSLLLGVSYPVSKKSGSLFTSTQMIATRAFFAMYPILTGSQQNLVLKRDFPGDQ